MVCIKRGAVIEADKAIHSQLRLINFSEGSPYETLHAFISKTMAPYFKSYVKETGRADRSVKSPKIFCSGPRLFNTEQLGEHS
jgi:dynein heavy chain 1